MPDVHYEPDETVKSGRDIMEAMRELSNAWNKFSRMRGVLVKKKLNEETGNDVYTQIAPSYLGADLAAQKANAAGSFGEIDSAFGAADAAITQMLNRHL